MAQLDSNIVLKAFATPQLDIVGTMRDAEDRRRQNAAYAQQQQAQQQQAQDLASQRNVVRQYGTDPAGARQAAFQTGNPQLVQQLDSMDDAGRKRTIDVARGTAPLVLSLAKVPAEQTAQAMQALAPELQARGWSPEHIAQVAQQLSDPNQREAAFASIQSSAQTIEEYSKAHAAFTLNEGARRFDGNGQMIAEGGSKPNVAIVEGPNGFYSVDKNTGRASPVTIGGAPASGGAPAGGGYIPPPANLIQTVTGGKGQVGSGFGPRTPPSPGASAFHNGVDVPLPAGTPVNAAADGTVIAAWNDTAHGGGQSVRIRHADGTVTGYADLGGYNVKVGQQVRAGQPIGTAGSSGSTSTGNHVHFSVRGPGGDNPAMGGQGEQLRGKTKPEKATPPGSPPPAGKPVPPAYSQSAMDAFDRAIGSIDQLKKHPGFSAMVGSSFDPASYFQVNGFTGKPFSGTRAAGFKARLDTLKAQVFLPMVQSMKGMGALSNAEGEKLTAAIGALDTAMPEDEFTASLDQIKHDLTTYKQRALGANAPTNTGPTKISGDADYAKLPSGAQFIGPDGHVRRKP